MLTRRRSEEGGATVEFALVLPILLAMIVFMAPLVKAGYEYMVLQRAVAHGVRFASRADVNPRNDGGVLTRRPSQAEVQQFVITAAQPIGMTPGDITVSPNPRLAVPGEQIVVTANYTISFGVLADIANSVKAALFGGGTFIADRPVTVSARGREE